MNQVDKFYRRLLARPRLVVLGFSVLVVSAAMVIPQLRLDASSDSLLLRGDPDLAYFRDSASRFGGGEFLLLTWSPNVPLLSSDSLEPLAAMVDELTRLDGVSSVNSILDVPLLESPPLSLMNLARAERIPTLRDPSIDSRLALKEFTTSPIYRKLLISESGDLTAVQVLLTSDKEMEALLGQRESLREAQSLGELEDIEKESLREIEKAYDEALVKTATKRDKLVADVRAVAERFRPFAQIFVGGVPMIAADMIAFVRADLVTFSIAILAVMAMMLWLIFRGVKWVVIPLSSCSVAAILLLGVLAGTDWRMTVISSNSVAVLLVVALSLSIHLVVRYRELQRRCPDTPRSELAGSAARKMMVPCFYTAITTIVAFASLVVAGIQPVIDFGWMMTVGIVIGFCTAFTLVPALMVIFPDSEIATSVEADIPFTRYLASVVERYGTLVIGSTFVLIVAAVLGIRSLQVENRFIDYFKDDTEIYQGMELLDARLGGTIPLDIIMEAPIPDIVPTADRQSSNNPDLSLEIGWDDEGMFSEDPLGMDFDFSADETKSTSFWFSLSGRLLIDQVHEIVEAREASGKVLSLSTVFEVMDRLYGGRLGGMELALMENSLPKQVEAALVTPYFNADADEVRLSVRVMETSESLRRDEYLRDLRDEILSGTGIEPERLHFTSLLVLYNNVLQSLFSSQIMTLGTVFVAIGLMFWILFRSISVALLALAPNILAAGLVLGLMGLAGIPLDIMTITIAAIVVGMGVDNCIHYLHRFRDEIDLDRDYRAAMYRSHSSIGRALFYTTLTVVVGFSMLTLSNFTPSLYFGLLTVVAMVSAVAGGLLLLPKLILIFRPFGHK